MKLFFCILFVFISVEIFSQTKEITIIIDTIDLKDVLEEQFIFFNVRQINKEKPENIGYGDIIYPSNSNLYLSYNKKINIENDSSSIIVSVDNNGSYIQFINLLELKSNNIHINKIVLLKNISIDTSEITYLYYKVKGDKVSENHYKEKSFRIVKNNNDYIKTNELIINNISYALEFFIDYSNPTFCIEHSSGFKYNNLLKKENKKRRICIFNDKTTYPRIARIILKN